VVGFRPNPDEIANAPCLCDAERDTVIVAMRLFAEDGYLRPKVQVAFGLIAAVISIESGIRNAMSPSLSTDRFFGILELIAVPACIYVAWHGYRKIKMAALDVSSTAEAPSRRRADWITVVCINVTIPVMVIWRYDSGDSTRGVALIVAPVSFIVLNVATLYAIMARNRRRNEPTPRSLILCSVVLALASAGAAVVGLDSTDPNDLLKLAYSGKPLNEIHPEQKRLFIELLRRKEHNSQEYGRLAASTKPIVPTPYDVESFASASVMNATSAALKKSVDADSAYFALQQKAERDFLDRMMRIDPDSSFLKAVQSQSEGEVASGALEQQWAAAR